MNKQPCYCQNYKHQNERLQNEVNDLKLAYRRLMADMQKILERHRVNYLDFPSLKIEEKVDYVKDGKEETIPEGRIHYPGLTRIEIINWRKKEECREYVHWDKKSKVSISFQDEGCTLKVFIEDKK